ncbi:glycosyltransferase [Paenibacillus sp. HB172176]|uniref:glycosyltransferase family 32 protein n=1 Tax=Paenibacillus sp. HB172176 TaxID=2493690 RepID=UPI00143AD9D9|nr:glycosyltransferase [Paenibacillus sp. HB172176]
MSVDEQIPRIIHYCWFGRGDKPKKIVKCMRSWAKQLNGYRFVEWNEDNFDVNAVPYVKEAYEARKFAFVSDYVRLHALYQVGGIYLDTDVEVIRPLDAFLENSAFSGFEDEHFLQSGTMGAIPGHPWIQRLLDDYQQRSFLLEDETYDMTTNTAVISRICKEEGLQLNGQLQALPNGVVFYPRTYFSPYDYINGGSYLTEDSHTIHHFAQSWLPARVRARSSLKRMLSKVAGPRMVSIVRKMFTV